MLALRALKDRQNLCAICYLYFFPHPKHLDQIIQPNKGESQHLPLAAGIRAQTQAYLQMLKQQATSHSQIQRSITMLEWQCQAARTWMDARLEEGVSIAQVALAVGISPAQLLQSTRLPLAALAERFGYADAFSFSRAFKRAMGVPPKDYRSRYSLS